MRRRIITLLCFTAFSPALLADEATMGPVIEDYGPSYPIADRDIALEEGFVYRVVFDAADYAGGETGVNQELVSVARFLNMHARNGVPLDKMDIAVVLHGAALKSAFTDEEYRSRYRIENPTLDLLMKLHGAGVKFYACGQSMAFNGVGKDDMASPVKVGLSAMTLLTVLQSKGYALLQ